MKGLMQGVQRQKLQSGGMSLGVNRPKTKLGLRSLKSSVKKIFTRPNITPEFIEKALAGRLCKNAGSGEYGTVNIRIAPDGFEHLKLAIKSSRTESYQSVKNEAEVGITLNHPNLMEYYGYQLEELPEGKKTASIVMLVMASTFETRFAGGIENNDTKEVVRLLSELTAALEYIHGRGMIHGDLKCDNVFLDEKERVVLGDFGRTSTNTRFLDNFNPLFPPEMVPFARGAECLSTFSDFSPPSPTNGSGDSGYCGNNGLVANETFDDSTGIAHSSDIYCLGVITSRMVLGKDAPYAWLMSKDAETGFASRDESHKVLDAMYAKLPATQASEQLIDLVGDCLQFDPKKRPTAQEVSKRLEQIISSSPKV